MNNKTQERNDFDLGGVIAIPQNLENLQLPDPDLLQFYQELDNRTYWLDTTVDQGVLELARWFFKFNREDELNNIPADQRKPIKIFLYTPGGDGQACLSLVDTIKMSKTPIYTINAGIAMSAGAIILLAGHKRFCFKNSIALIHSGSGATQGTYEQTAAQMKDYEHFIAIMKEFILSNSKIDLKLYNKHKTSEWYIYSKEQKELGIVDEILETSEDLEKYLK